MGSDRKIRKIWVAMSTPFQANFFAPLIEKLSNDYDFIVTAREHDRISSILEARGIEFVNVGKHGGKSLESKLDTYAKNIQELLPVVKKERPDLLLTERWPEAVRVAFGLNIPSWGIFYDEREKHVNRMVFPLLNKVFAPRFYTLQELYQNGVADPSRIVWFNGFHTCYLKGERKNGDNPFKKLGLKEPVVLVRPEPEFASFFPEQKPILSKAVESIVKRNNSSVVVIPRTQSQKNLYASIGAEILDIPSHESPVAHADVVVGAAETMLMEALVLKRPTVSAIYWELSKPVIELHRYVKHSTDPRLVSEYVNMYVEDEEQRRAFSERAELIVRSMDDPVKIMEEEILRIESREEKESLRRRSQLEIYVDVIRAVSVRPLRTTHIMNTANVSYKELRKIIEKLERKTLITVESSVDGKYYTATEQGLRLLEEYKSLKSKLFDF